MRVVTAIFCLAVLASTAMASPNFDGAINPDPGHSNLIIQSWPYVNCDPMGIDYEAASGLVWVADQGGTSTQGDCPPAGQIYTFDPVAGTFNLEFVTSVQVPNGSPDIAANGIEVVGDFVYVADFNGDVTNYDDSIYKFEKDGTFVIAYDLSAVTDQIVGLGYLSGVFYVTNVAGDVLGFVESGGSMNLVFTGTLPVVAGGGGLDWDESCQVWLHVDFRNTPEEVYVMDAGFNLLGAYPAETTNPIGVTYGPDFVGLAAMYVISRDDVLYYKTNDHPDCTTTTPVESSTWGTIKGMYR